MENTVITAINLEKARIEDTSLTFTYSLYQKRKGAAQPDPKQSRNERGETFLPLQPFSKCGILANQEYW
jgi:hypothetical protein